MVARPRPCPSRGASEPAGLDPPPTTSSGPPKASTARTASSRGVGQRTYWRWATHAQGSSDQQGSGRPKPSRTARVRLTSGQALRAPGSRRPARAVAGPGTGARQSWADRGLLPTAPEGTVTSSGNVMTILPRTWPPISSCRRRAPVPRRTDSARDSQTCRVTSPADCCDVGDLSVAPAGKARARRGRSRWSWNECPRALLMPGRWASDA